MHLAFDALLQLPRLTADVIEMFKEFRALLIRQRHRRDSASAGCGRANEVDKRRRPVGSAMGCRFRGVNEKGHQGVISDGASASSPTL